MSHRRKQKDETKAIKMADQERKDERLKRRLENSILNPKVTVTQRRKSSSLPLLTALIMAGESNKNLWVRI